MFEQGHWHWGSAEDVGSEHMIDGQSYPLELHLVHYNEKYSTFDEALKHPDGLLVLGLFYAQAREGVPQVGGKKEIAALKPFVKMVRGVRRQGSTVEDSSSEGLQLSSLLMGETKNDFITYQGSLTTPPCNQVVTWIIFNDLYPIHKRDIKVFRAVEGVPNQKSRGQQQSSDKGGAGGKGQERLIGDNWRNPQPINGRRVRSSFEPDNSHMENFNAGL